jgi:hypothetical protein
MSTIKAILTCVQEGYLSHEMEKKHILQWEQSHDKDDKSIIMPAGTCVHYERQPKVINKQVNISEEAYNYWISPESMPASYSHDRKNYHGKSWKELSKNQRFEYHCQIMADGNEYTVKVLD